MLTNTDYSTKNKPSVDRAIYLITMISYYISKKNHIIFIYQFVDLILLARATNRRKGLSPHRDYVLSVVQTSPDKVLTPSELSRLAPIEQISEALVKYVLTRFCKSALISCQSPHMTLETNFLTWEESEREGVSEPISVRTVMSIINCIGDISDRHGHCQ